MAIFGDQAKEVLNGLPDNLYDFVEADLADLSTIAAAGDPESWCHKLYSLTPQGHGHHALIKCLDSVVIETALKFTKTPTTKRASLVLCSVYQAYSVPVFEKKRKHSCTGMYGNAVFFSAWQMNPV